MSVELILLPFDCDLPTIAYAHTVLSCGGSYPLWAAIEALPTTPVPADFTSYLSREGNTEDPPYGEPHYGVTSADAYGTPLQACMAGELALLQRHPGVQQHATNRAIWAYLGALPPATRIGLYWH